MQDVQKRPVQNQPPAVLMMHRKRHKKMTSEQKTRALVVGAIIATSATVIIIAILIALGALGLIGKKTVSQEMAIGITAPKSAEQGVQEKWLVSVTNNKHKTENIIVRVASQGIDLTVADPLTVISADDVGAYFGSDWSSKGAQWNLGRLSKGKTATAEIMGMPTFQSGQNASLAVQVYSQKESYRRCKFLWLFKCDIQIKDSKLASAQSDIGIVSTSQKRDSITLYKGYNLVSLPIKASNASLQAFWGQFVKPLGWHLDAQSQGWHAVTESTYYVDLIPGNGQWIYHPDGGEVALPEGDGVDAETNYNIELFTGWNQIGNPYKYRIKFDGDKILIKRSGKETLSLSGALQSGVITRALGMAGPASGSTTEPTYVDIVTGRYLPIGAGMFFSLAENASIVFPGKVIFAPGELLSTAERARIISWINTNGLDVCGNKPSSELSVNPLQDDQTGEILDQFDCIIIKHPSRPWNS